MQQGFTVHPIMTHNEILILSEKKELSHFDVHLKPTQYCNQLSIFLKILKL